MATTKRSPAAMAAFTIGMCVVPYYAGKVVMAGTNMRAEEGTSLEQQLRARQTLEHKARLLCLTCVLSAWYVQVDSPMRRHTTFWLRSVLLEAHQRMRLVLVHLRVWRYRCSLFSVEVNHLCALPEMLDS